MGRWARVLRPAGPWPDARPRVSGDAASSSTTSARRSRRVYDRLLEVGVRDGHPMLTFTSAHGSHDVAPTAPAKDYLRTIGEGVAEAHGWEPARVAEYLARLAVHPSG